MKKGFNRLVGFLLACVMCLSLGTVAFAAETEKTVSNNVEISAVDEEISTLANAIYSSGGYFTGIYTDWYTLESGNFSTDFVITVSNAPNSTYFVKMITPNNEEYTQTISGNNGTAHFNLFYAAAGYYHFTIEHNSGPQNTAYVTVQILD